LFGRKHADRQWLELSHRRSCLGKIEAALNTLDTVAQSVDAHRLLGNLDVNLRNFALKCPNTTFDLAHVLTRFVNNMPEVFEHDIVGFHH
jgi:hypothetical protein